MFESRGFNFLMAFICYQLLIVAFYFQYVENLLPCPLCVFQRIGVLFVGIWFLLRALHNPQPGSGWSLSYSILGFISATLGSIVSIRHLYLQSLPADQVPACGASLDFLMEMLPINEVISTVLAGDGECAKIAWSMWGISMPGWVLIFFASILVLMSRNIYRHFKPDERVMA
ncbi:MAG: disulfide bond formation protein B [Gammaproteobacteria bacterium]|nr:disulfide bond formation protein B [Gammaproteobacteria bacterium]MDH5631337.1 disulfide bond formation protein B [Gammaproteobacteria bacterium]